MKTFIEIVYVPAVKNRHLVSAQKKKTCFQYPRVFRARVFSFSFESNRWKMDSPRLVVGKSLDWEHIEAQAEVKVLKTQQQLRFIAWCMTLRSIRHYNIFIRR